MKLKIAALVCVLALVASSAFASGMQWVSLNAGGTFPMGDLKDDAGTGFFGGASYGYGVSKNAAVGADVDYHMFGKKTFTDPSDPSISVDVKPKVTQFDVAGYWMFPMKDPKAFPYVKVAVGGYNINPDVQGAETKTKLGVSGGLGYNYGINDQMAIGLDANYHWISTGSDYKKADGSNATFSMVTVGVHVGWGFGAGSGMKKK